MGKIGHSFDDGGAAGGASWLLWSTLFIVVPALAILAYVILAPTPEISENGAQNPSGVAVEHGFGQGEARGEDSTEGPQLRVAVAPVVSPEASLMLYRGLVDYLGEAVGRKGVMIQRSSYSEINALIRQDQVDMAFVCTYSYVQGADDFGLMAIATPVVRGHSHYRSLFIVPSSSKADSIFDLQGKRLASSDILSNTGWLYPSYLLRRKGLDIKSFFSEIVFTHGHDRAVKAVASRFVDGAAVDNLVYEQLSHEDPTIAAGTRVVMKSPEFGMPPVVIPPKVDPRLRERLKRVLLSMHESADGRAILR
ncbi:MAG: phosphate/phosphite/phosphonate ABC transporter substrate-binding protein, partial [Deltaproteobacteria bacterium]|nr:phosphate/phosphite/phosphonate ABC transporter substrate-binding protein [Deltaproteobacteria bacterium]